MYKILNSMVAIVIVGAISTQICGMEKEKEKRAADPLAALVDGSAKRQRVDNQRETATNDSARQRLEMAHEDETVPPRPVIRNSPILNMITGFGTLIDLRMSQFEAETRAHFAQSDMTLRNLARALEALQRVMSLQPDRSKNTQPSTSAEDKERSDAANALNSLAGCVPSNED